MCNHEKTFTVGNKTYCMKCGTVIETCKNCKIDFSRAEEKKPATTSAVADVKSNEKSAEVVKANKKATKSSKSDVKGE